MKSSCFVLIACLACYANAHSWIACSDYAEKNAADWDPAKCRGFPRKASQYARKESFGVDTGYDFRPSANGPGCPTRYSDSPYSDEYPKAVYYRGQQVILAHPMKNHGADPRCTSKYIPDSANLIYRGRRNTDRDLTFSEYRRIRVADLGISPFGQNADDEDTTTYPKTGYQNAPKFCENTDKSMGTYSFNVPNNLEAGEYTFVWRWSFNSENDMYATCFDVIVTDTIAERNARLQTRNVQDLSIACGGLTSNNSPGSIIGCDPSNIPPPPPTREVTQPPVVQFTTRRPSTTRQPSTIQGRSVPVKISQMQGEIELGRARNNVRERYVTVNYACKVQANMWNGQLYENKNRVYKMLLSGKSIANGNPQFVAGYPNGCDFADSRPNALVRDL